MEDFLKASSTQDRARARMYLLRGRSISNQKLGARLNGQQGLNSTHHSVGGKLQLIHSRHQILGQTGLDL